MKYYPDGQPNGKGAIPEMTGNDLVLSGTRADYGQNGLPVVLLQFNGHGSKQFERITKSEANAGQTAYDLGGRSGDYLNYVKHFAIVLDQKLESTPYIDFKNTPNGIPGPNAEIDLGAGGAIAAGYGKGFHTILDANVVTAITALVLFLIAVASVKGFALMLLIGTLISLLTAVAATRALLGLLAGFKWFDNPRFMGAQGAQTAKWLQIDFMKYRYLWFGISGAIILAGAISLGVRGMNWGIDFKGGTQVSFNTHKGYTTEDVNKVAAAPDVGRPD